MRRSLILLLAIALAPFGFAADEARIGKLIAQLGSASFTEREEATRTLEGIGLPALAALKQAAQSNDFETRQRAEALVARLEKLQESARLLAPTRVTLRFTDTPLPQAVAELARQSKQMVTLGGDLTKLNGRSVTLDARETPFWEALAQFCAAARLVEAATVSAPIPPPGTNRRRPASGVVSPHQAARQIVLVDGQPAALPTHHAGAARLRALPAGTHLLTNQPKGAGEILFALGLGLEAQVPLQRIINVRIDQATDEHGQALTVLAANPAPAADPDAPIFLGNLNGRPQAIASTAGQTQLPIRLKAGAQPAKRLKELTGLVALEIRTPPEPVMTMDDILKAAGKTVKGAQGGALTVREVTTQDDGQVRIKVELDQPPETNQPNAQAGGIQMQGNVIFGGMVRIGDNSLGGLFGRLGLSLVDGKGEPFSLAGHQTHQVRINNNQVTHETTLLFKPQAGQGAPAKLIYTATRPATVEIPFTLKDVPLP